MNLTKCSQGHFYDADKDAYCPHCQSMNVGGPNITVPIAPPPIVDSFQPGGMKTEPLTAPVTAGVFPGGQATERLIPDPAPNPAPNPAPIPDPVTPDVDDVGKTIAIPTKGASKESVSYVVGWLVAVAGPHIGQDFKLVSGKNFIGRNASMDVALKLDKSVSREKQSAIIFEPNEGLFLIQEGESTQLTYLNGSLVLSAKELKAFDKIKVGETELIFMPLCSKDFSWDAYTCEEDAE